MERRITITRTYIITGACNLDTVRMSWKYIYLAKIIKVIIQEGWGLLMLSSHD